jgi:hypothetical protein
VRARREAGDSSVWLLTNYGWVEEKAIGNANKRKAVAMYFDVQPTAVKVIRARFVDAPAQSGWFSKKKEV